MTTSSSEYKKPFITKLRLTNFRSIKDAVITFDNPVFLAGQNGAGKSNIIDALSFLSQCVSGPLPRILQNRRISPENKTKRDISMGLRVDFEIPHRLTPLTGHYAFTLTKPYLKRTIVDREQCVVSSVSHDKRTWYSRTQEDFDSNIQVTPALSSHSLALQVLGGVTQFTPILEHLSEMRFYHINSQTISGISELDGITELNREGTNLATVLYYLGKKSPKSLKRISQFVQAVVPSISSVEAKEISWDEDGHAEDVKILATQDMEDGKHISLDGSHLSDGTLRTLAMLVAIMQDSPSSLIAIEEPEIAIHPGALDAIADIIEYGATRSQMIISTHSPDLLDAKWIKPENIRVVNWVNGETLISNLASGAADLLRRRVAGAGELLRHNALDEEEFAKSDATSLFDEIPT